MDTVTSLMHEVLEAVRFLSSIEIVHAGLKPENIMLYRNDDDTMTARVGDFSNSRRPGKGPCLTSAWYRPPEASRTFRGIITPGVDVWGAGCVLSEMYTGAALFNMAKDDEDDYVYRVVALLGMPPATLTAEVSAHMKKRLAALDTSGVATVSPRRRLAKVLGGRISGRDTAYAERLLCLVGKMLTWDAEARIDAASALQDPFFSQQKQR